MIRMHKRTKALQFSKKARQRLIDRDGGCIFCKLGYEMTASSVYDYSVLEAMHIVGKAQGGLGIEQNGVIGCHHHHHMHDNGNKGLRKEMEQIIDHYMISRYPDWNRNKLVYVKDMILALRG